MDKYKLVSLEKERLGEGFTFSEGEFVFGRGDDSPFRISDATISRRHFILQADDKGVTIKDLASRNATYVNGQELKNPLNLNPGDRITAGKSEFIFFSLSDSAAGSLRGESLYLSTICELESDNPSFSQASTQLGNVGILGKSPSILKIMASLKRVAPSDATVLITGESGTGKELIASAIHHMSSRKSENFCAINCAAIPLELMESELFGHEKGAFTGAYKKKIGKFEFAHKGTLFLDEIGDMPLSIQAALLRAIEYREFSPVGAEKIIKSDLRIIAATNLNLEEMINERRFRQDLFYRLNVINIVLPSLRDRLEDIPLLFKFFTSYFEQKYALSAPVVTPSHSEEMLEYHWPGNIRELRNYCERTVVLGESLSPGKNPAARNSQLVSSAESDGKVHSNSQNKNIEALTRENRHSSTSHVEESLSVAEPAGSACSDDLITLKELEKHHISRVLTAVNFNKSKACNILGIQRSTLYDKIRQYEIKS